MARKSKNETKRTLIGCDTAAQRQEHGGDFSPLGIQQEEKEKKNDKSFALSLAVCVFGIEEQ